MVSFHHNIYVLKLVSVPLVRVSNLSTGWNRPSSANTLDAPVLTFTSVAHEADASPGDYGLVLGLAYGGTSI